MAGEDLKRVQSFFTYPAPALTLAPGASGSSIITIESATDFLWFKSAFRADDTAAVGGQTDSTRIIPAWDVQIQVSGSDRNLLQAAGDMNSIFGSGNLPFVMPAPMVLLANSQVTITATSRESANTLRVQWMLIGLKDYGVLQAASPAGA